MKRIVLICGLLAGLVASATMAISMTACYKNPNAHVSSSSMVIGYLSMLIAFSLIFVAVKNYRDKHLNGHISFGKAFKIGLFISLIGSTMYVITWAILYNYFMPDFMEVYGAQMIREAERSGNAATIQKSIEEVKGYKEMYKNPLFFSLMTYAEILPVGLLVSLITSLILKRKNREETVAMA